VYKKIENIKKIAIISDTHDNIETIEKAVNKIKHEHVGLIIHAGDCTTPEAIEPFLKLNKYLVCVYGNCDTQKEKIKAALGDKGIINNPPFVFYVNDRKILLTHDLEKCSKKIKEEQPNIVIFGHDHIVEIEENKDVLYINPGECGGLLYGSATITILNMKTLHVDIIEL
jgi:uncharacterized protein